MPNKNQLQITHKLDTEDENTHKGIVEILIVNSWSIWDFAVESLLTPMLFQNHRLWQLHWDGHLQIGKPIESKHCLALWFPDQSVSPYQPAYSHQHQHYTLFLWLQMFYQYTYTSYVWGYCIHKTNGDNRSKGHTSLVTGLNIEMREFLRGSYIALSQYQEISAPCKAIAFRTGEALRDIYHTGRDGWRLGLCWLLGVGQGWNCIKQTIIPQ